MSAGSRTAAAKLRDRWRAMPANVGDARVDERRFGPGKPLVLTRGWWKRLLALRERPGFTRPVAGGDRSVRGLVFPLQARLRTPGRGGLCLRAGPNFSSP